MSFAAFSTFLKSFSRLLLVKFESIVSHFHVFAVKHAMIVTEYMENGALDRYLRVSPAQTV